MGDDIDDLIQKLQELSQPKTKYKVGDEVWMIEYDEPKSFIIDSVCGLKYYLYKHDFGLVKQSELYPTKSALIEAQIKYWIDELKKLPEFPSLTGQCSVGCNENHRPPFEGPIKGFNHPADNLEKVECQHEPEMDIGKDDRPRYIKSKNPKCMHCGEFYKVGCEHESDGKMYGAMEWGAPRSFRCKKCGEFYR